MQQTRKAIKDMKKGRRMKNRNERTMRKCELERERERKRMCV